MKYLLEEIKAILEGIPQGEWSFEDNEMCIEGVPICTFFTAEDFPCVPIEDEPKLEEELKRLKSFIAAASTIIRDLLVEVERLREDIEQLRVQLAACGVAAMCNTKQSRGQQKCVVGDYGWSQSYQDVVNAVGREIALRDQLQAAQAENERLSALAAQHLADQELLVGQERKRVARECIDYVNSHASDCGCSKRIAHDIRARYGVEG